MFLTAEPEKLGTKHEESINLFSPHAPALTTLQDARFLSCHIILYTSFLSFSRSLIGLRGYIVGDVFF